MVFSVNGKRAASGHSRISLPLPSLRAGQGIAMPLPPLRPERSRDRQGAVVWLVMDRSKLHFCLRPRAERDSASGVAQLRQILPGAGEVRL
jgi:hypothetical protein